MEGDELYVHYGNSYAPRRDYPVGAAAKLRKQDIDHTQWPAYLDWLRMLPMDSWRYATYD